MDDDKKLRLDYASATEAMQILGVRAQTLYAYVSRGWVRSIAMTSIIASASRRR